MWNFGPDQAWEDKGVLFIRTPRIQKDWSIREYRKTMLWFQGKSYFPSQLKETGKHILYRFESFDPAIEMPGLTMDYDEEYVKIREDNRNRPLRQTLIVITVGVCLLIGWKILQSTQSHSGIPQAGGSLITASNTTFNLESFQGKYIWLDFSAPWCGPCRSQAPHMKKLEESGLDAVFITIIVSDTGRRKPTLRTVEDWADKYDLNPDRVVADLSGSFNQKWKVRSIPLNVLISPTGKILYRQSGTHREGDVKRVLSKYF